MISTVASLLTSNATETHHYMWESFKREHMRSYATVDEDSKRFGFFIDNLRLIKERNSAETGSAVHGINKFSDLSHEEFASRFLTSKKPEGLVSLAKTAEVAAASSSGVVDWTGVYTTPVKDQGYCGSCWAFSATEQIESDYMRATGNTYILSPQQVTSCDKTSFACGGGWTEHAYNYVMREGGVETDADYPYTSGAAGVDGTCNSDKSKEVVGISSFFTVASESDMGSYVTSTGPLSVCVDANSWSSYTGGIMSTCGNSVDHCVQAVGVDTSSNGYWKVRNSWGTSWGESGFIRLAYGQDTCAIASDPTYTTIA